MNLPKIKFRKDSKKIGKTTECAQGKSEQIEQLHGRAAIWKGLSLCRRVQTKDYFGKDGLKAGVWNTVNTVQRTLHKIQQYPLLYFPNTVCLQCLCGEENAKADRAYSNAQQSRCNGKAEIFNSEARYKPWWGRPNLMNCSLILKGQPLTHIWSFKHAMNFGISQRTLYRPRHRGVLSVGNIDLRRKVAWSQDRKKKKCPAFWTKNSVKTDAMTIIWNIWKSIRIHSFLIQMDTVKV